MAFSDSKAKFWQIDLTSRSGAESATKQAELAGFGMTIMAILGMFLLGGLAGFSTVEGKVVVAAAGLEALVGLVAGLRFRAGKGAFWGIVALALMTLEFVAKLAAVSSIGIVITGILCVFLFNGIRGAFALKRGKFDDDIADVFR